MNDPYEIQIGGVKADPYRIAMAYGLDPVLAQALKKILRCGKKHKSSIQDVEEVITTCQRWLEIQREEVTKDPKPDDEGWIEWRGGECPVDSMQIVQIKVRDGRVLEWPAGQCRWQETGAIIAYRPSK